MHLQYMHTMHMLVSLFSWLQFPVCLNFSPLNFLLACCYYNFDKGILCLFTQLLIQSYAKCSLLDHWVFTLQLCNELVFPDISLLKKTPQSFGDFLFLISSFLLP